MNFAAIDIGSNAVRLLFAVVYEENGVIGFKKEALIRMPVRLGADVFRDGRISEEKANALTETMVAFEHLIAAQRPVDYMACATSAMREATNGTRIVDRIRRQTNLDIEIISGSREAEILLSNHVVEQLELRGTFLYIDVGGGSTEVSLYSHYSTLSSRSFNIGTVRLLQNLVEPKEWQDLKKYVKSLIKKHHCSAAIGTGGNINKLHELSRLKKNTDPLKRKKIKKLYSKLKSCDFNERMDKWSLRPDRADVIVPASKIYLSIMKWAKISKIYVPKVGLADGMIHILYAKHQQARSNES